MSGEQLQLCFQIMLTHVQIVQHMASLLLNVAVAVSCSVRKGLGIPN